MDSVALQDPQIVAEEAGLHYVSDDRPGITRIKAGRGFAYYRNDTLIKDDKTLARIRLLAIPPAWRGSASASPLLRPANVLPPVARPKRGVLWLF